jgi:hypothetical protein
LAAQGAVILMINSDMERFCMSDRFAVMHEGLPIAERKKRQKPSCRLGRRFLPATRRLPTNREERTRNLAL